MLESTFLAHKKWNWLGRFGAVLLPLICIVLLLTQVAFAKTTYRISDGDNVMLYATYTTDPEEILDEVGLELGEDDTFTTQDGIGVSQINIQRKQEVTVECGSRTWTMISYGETVGELLARMGMKIDEDDTVSVGLDTQTYDGLCVVITNIVTVEETYTVSIDYETEYFMDASLLKGAQVILNEGSLGQMSCVDVVTYVNGEEVERTTSSQTVLIQPENRVIAVGNRLPAPQNTVIESTGKAPGDLIIGDGVIITPEGEVLTYTDSLQVVATAYHNTDPGCTIYTSTGTLCRVGAIAVDPKVIPYGTRMYIVTNDGQYIYGIAVAEDCGSAIKGNRVDLYYDTVKECWAFGIREATVYFLG